VSCPDPAGFDIELLIVPRVELPKTFIAVNLSDKHIHPDEDTPHEASPQ
jgi:hypothetical protein